MRINRHDTNGTKPLLGKGELGYDDYTAGGDAGRVYVGTGSVNIPQAKKAEVVAVDGKVDTHVARIDNPHSVTKTQVGLSNVDNTSDIDKPISTAVQTALDTKQAVLVSGTNIKTIEGQSIVGSGNIDLSKSDVGLSNVDNTADSSKNVLSATKFTNARNIALTGDVDGNANLDGSTNISIDVTLDIDGATDIGVNLSDTDLIIVDKGANGTNRKSAISRIWTYISGKLTGAISTVITSNLTASKVLVSDVSGKIAVSTTTSTELGYVSGVTSAIQTQLNAKVETNGLTVTDNAIVRFDGATGKVQNSSVTIDDNGNIGSGTQSFNGFGGSGFKNYIINGNFNVWQRGTSFSVVGYCADRWQLAIGGSAYAMKHNNEPNTLLVSTTAASSFANLYQAIETATVMGLRGKTLTLSLKLQTGGTHTGGFALSARYSNSTDTLNSQTTDIQSLGISASSTNTRYSLTFTVPADAVGLRIDIENTSVQPSEALYQVQEVQLEEGSIATPFENRPYGLELSMCQRYFFIGGTASSGVFASASTARFNVKLPSEMRVSPSVTPILAPIALNSTVAEAQTGSQTLNFGVTGYAASVRHAVGQIQFGGFSSGVDGRPTVLLNDALSFSAEL